MTKETNQFKRTTYGCPNWVYSPQSEFHIAVRRHSFTAYQERPTTVYDQNGNAFVADGVGHVVLKVRPTWRKNQKHKYGTIELFNVLHVPNAPVNILGCLPAGLEMDSGRHCSIRGEVGGMVVSGTRDLFVSFQPPFDKECLLATDKTHPCYFLQTEYMAKILGTSPAFFSAPQKSVSDPRATQLATPAHNQTTAMARVPETSINPGPSKPKAKPFQDSSKATPAPAKKPEPLTKAKPVQAKATPAPAKKPEPLTKAEKAWIKTNFQTEYMFLKEQGLHIHIEADRHKGWEIARQIMTAGGIGDTGGQIAVDNGVPGDAYTLTADERVWVKKHFGSEYAFLKDHDCFFHIPKHRKKGFAIARAMIASGCMSDDEDDEDEDTKTNGVIPMPPTPAMSAVNASENVDDTSADVNSVDLVLDYSTSYDESLGSVSDDATPESFRQGVARSNYTTTSCPEDVEDLLCFDDITSASTQPLSDADHQAVAIYNTGQQLQPWYFEQLTLMD